MIVFLLFAPYTAAQIALTNDVQLSGFGTFSATRSDNSTPVLVHRDITNEWCFDCDSTLGLQLDWLANSELRATVQVIKRPQDHFSSPELEQAFLEYTLNNSSIKTGRLRAPLSMMSEFYYVSAAYPWLRLPPEIYASQLGITHYEGLTADISFDLADEVQLTISPFYAIPDTRSFERYGESYTLETSRALGISSELFYAGNLIHFAFMNTEASQFSQSTQKSAFNLNVVSIGLSHYFDQLHFQAETMLSNDIAANWYAGFDYQVGDFTPYIQYGQKRIIKDAQSYLVGFRYDWTSQINTSLEWQLIEGDKNVISGYFTELQNPGQALSSKVQLISLGLSFTF
ncbi:sulfate ABC transporter permease [Vibrio sp. TBV020]|uniref:sulfate ABC transporter permease n=1 Tax=Vibrio sp. TBV020 TaxID=3137398 RepID=UPI0038CD7D67